MLSSCESGLSAVSAGRRADGVHRGGVRARHPDRDRRRRPRPRRDDEGPDARARRRAEPRRRRPRRRSSTRAPRSRATTAGTPWRAPRSSASAPADYPGTSEDRAVPPDGRARPDRRRGAVLRADDPGVRRQAVPDPVGLDAAHARARPAHPRQPLLAPHRRRPEARRRDRVPAAARSGDPHLRPSRRGPHLRRRRPGDPPLVLAGNADALGDRVRQARRRPARRHDRGHQRPRDPQRQGREGAVRERLLRARLQPEPDQDPARLLLPDGRQPRQLRGQPLLGPGAARLDHRQGGRVASGRRTTSARFEPDPPILADPRHRGQTLLAPSHPRSISGSRLRDPPDALQGAARTISAC